MKRHIDDIDGMYEDIRESFFNWNKAELIDFIMEQCFQDTSEEIIKINWENIIKGELYD